MILTWAVTFGLLFKKQRIENNAFFALTFTRSKSRKNHACSAGHEKPVKKRKMQMVLRVRERTINKEGIFNHVLGETLKRKKTQVSHLLCRICLPGHKRTRQCSRTLLTHQYIRDGSIGSMMTKEGLGLGSTNKRLLYACPQISQNRVKMFASILKETLKYLVNFP